MRGQEQRAGWRRPLVWAAVVTALWLVVGGQLGSFQGRLAGVQENDNAAFLPATAEATRVAELQRQFTGADALPAIVVIESSTGLTDADLARLEQTAQQVTELPGVTGPASPPVRSPDGAAVQLVVPLVDDDRTADTVIAVRGAFSAGAPQQAAVYVTGPAGFATDLGEAFGDIDSLLLLVTASVVAVILVVVYRSPLLPLVVLLGAGLALGTASAVVYGLTRADVVVLNGQSQGIMLILVFGAATDYALLLVARYREELRHHRDRFAAMNLAWRRSVRPILASGLTVILALLCLLLSDLNSNRSLGPVAAVGVASALLVMLTYLPAALALLGRVAFWPFRPRYGAGPAPQRGLWERLAALVSRRDRLVWLVTVLALAGLASLLPLLRADGVAQTPWEVEQVVERYRGDTQGRGERQHHRGQQQGRHQQRPQQPRDHRKTTTSASGMTDPSLPLFAFVFLVALGVDYSIFLMTRVREEAVQRGTRAGVQEGLAVTGRVITSAGVVLAATFSALGVIPILFLAQIAFLVAMGVLIDTLVVRSLLVPGLCHDIGSRIWWPSQLSGRG